MKPVKLDELKELHAKIDYQLIQHSWCAGEYFEEAQALAKELRRESEAIHHELTLARALHEALEDAITESPDATQAWLDYFIFLEGGE